MRPFDPFNPESEIIATGTAIEPQPNTRQSPDRAYSASELRRLARAVAEAAEVAEAEAQAVLADLTPDQWLSYMQHFLSPAFAAEDADSEAEAAAAMERRDHQQARAGVPGFCAGCGAAWLVRDTPLCMECFAEMPIGDFGALFGADQDE